MADRKRKHSRRVPVIRRAAPPGSAPGTLTVDPTAPKPRIRVFAYGPEGHEEVELASADEVVAHRGRSAVLWINIDGLGDLDTLRTLGEQFGLHRLALEDVVNVPQRAKLEAYDEHLFLVARMITPGKRPGFEQMSLVVGPDYLLTFQERVGDAFERVRGRIRAGQGRLRKAGPDYLAYALVDALIDAYYPLLEQYGDRLETLEEEVLASPDGDVGARIHSIKRELLMIRRALAPHREALHALLRDESPFVSEETRLYIRDCFDHVVQLLDMLETYRELSAGLLDIHLATVSNRMNEIMKVLTIFAAIFIPLGFIAGVYGMNFSQESRWNMPELSWAFGYPAALAFMATVACGLLLLFRRWGWIGSRTPRHGDDGKHH